MLTAVPPSDCMQAREAVSARLDGELSELETLRLEAHLSTCAACRAFAADAAGLARTLRGATLEAAPAELFVPRRRRVAMPFAAAAATLVIAAATGSSFFLGELLGGRDAGTGNGTRTAAATVAAPTDPIVLAMLRGQDRPQPQTGRVIAL
jgi:predicted anti-sigma-YlaC factor YlaD